MPHGLQACDILFRLDMSSRGLSSPIWSYYVMFVGSEGGEDTKDSTGDNKYRHANVLVEIWEGPRGGECQWGGMDRWV